MYWATVSGPVCGDLRRQPVTQAHRLAGRRRHRRPRRGSAGGRGSRRPRQIRKSADQHHRDRQDHPHGQAEREVRHARRRARARSPGRCGTGRSRSGTCPVDHAAAVQPLRAVGRPAQDQEQHQRPPAPPRRAGSGGGRAGRAAAVGLRIGRCRRPCPRARSVGRPQSSPLMKLAMRPRNGRSARPRRSGRPAAAGRSCCARRRAMHGDQHASAPPWKLMPPCQTFRISSGSGPDQLRVV